MAKRTTAKRAIYTLPYLADWRLHYGLSQKVLMTKSGIGRSTIERAEAGHGVTKRTVYQLAAALKLSPDALQHDNPADLIPERKQPTAN